MAGTNNKSRTPKNTLLIKVISYLYLASLVYIFVFSPAYIGVVFATMLFWLSFRGILSKNLLMGSSTVLRYGPIKGGNVRIISFFLFLVSIGWYYWLLAISGLHLNLLAIAGIFVYIPLVILVGMCLKLHA